MVCFHTTKMPGFRGCHGARQLKWGDFKPVYVENGEISYIEWNERETKTRNGTNTSSSRVFTPKLFPNNEEDSCKCPVKAFLTYKEHRPDSTLHHHAPFYIAINYNLPNSSAAWYKNNAIANGSWLNWNHYEPNGFQSKTGLPNCTK